MGKKYDFQKIEKKWQSVWRREGTYEPSFGKAQKPFYNLMMFPYPSAEGLHVGNMYAFTGSDVYGRFKRMQGYDVFEPMGLDGFGIHSENYALKIGAHPMKQAKISEKRFYKQLEVIGNGFSWNERLETYDPDYYKWTQWIFVQMFKNGLAYRKKQPVNWCPSCKTVLADEQVLQKSQIPNPKSQTNSKSQIQNHKHEIRIGVCERCDTPVVKKELEQWFFRITKYAGRLLKNLGTQQGGGIDWSERVKIAQRNWIGKSEGAEIDFEIAGGVAPSYVLLHGYTGTPKNDFRPWLKKELERRGAKVHIPSLPHTKNPRVAEQVEFVLKNVPFNKNTVILGHSLGAIVALKVLEKLKQPVRSTVLVAGFTENNFLDHDRFDEQTFDWKFDAKRIRANAGDLRILRDTTDAIVPPNQAWKLQNLFGGVITEFAAQEPHVCGKEEPEVLRSCIDSIRVFTTRPDTLFGATYMVLAPEHPLVASLLAADSRRLDADSRGILKNKDEVKKYIEKAKKKSEEERTAEGKDFSTGTGQAKTGVELKGIRAINPATKEEIPVWVADYVLAGYGTGAIMAVPAHDERDWEFAKKYKLPVKMTVCPHYPAQTCPILDTAYEGEGHLVDSGKFNGMASETAKWEITKFVGGARKTQYRLRDWLISRQRYWGPPIPLVFCEHCAAQINADGTRINADNIGENLRSNRRKSAFTKGELENPGWIAVPEDKLPVRLPFVKDFQPKGKGESPLGTVKSFYETKCPKCGGKARRETDVSDTFLDSAWYYIGYLATSDKRQGKVNPFENSLAKKWLPVDTYIGGAEHSVLHLLYSRFLALALQDIGVLHFSAKGGSAPGGEEPFTKFRAHGLLIKEGSKMSKSKGNVVNPDEYIRKFGADTLRMYLMFLAPFEQGGDFRDSSILGISRFLERAWKLFANQRHGAGDMEQVRKKGELDRLLHKTVKKVTEDIENLRYNTAISALMILLNKIEETNPPMSHVACRIFPKLLAPFAPHLAEELYQTQIDADRKAADKRGYVSIHLEQWPIYDPKLIEEKTFTLIIQVNGKVRDTMPAPAGTSEQEAKEMAFDSGKIKGFIHGGKIVKTVYIPGRLINIVTESC
ncbi:MAG: alpha/beta fold hydrolase [Candidatus Liptonbacteria bacterium]|nr:alpha/beta fold hydrolase [Candidatus Liptonbacteria bacterium]